MRSLKLTLEELRFLFDKYKREQRNIGKVYKIDNITEELNKFLKDE